LLGLYENQEVAIKVLKKDKLCKMTETDLDQFKKEFQILR
jgi:hypothetical protein